METDTLKSVPEAGLVLGIRDSLVRKLIREGTLLSVKVGDRRLIPTSAIRAYIARLVAEAEQERVGVA